MKYIKSLKLFLEEVDIDDTDKPDERVQKQDLNTILKHIKEYDSGIKKIDDILLKNKDKSPDDITKLLDVIIGKDDDRNLFLSEYTTAARMKKQIENIQDQILRDKIRQDDFKSSLSDAEGDTKTALNAKIVDISNRITQSNSKINDLNKEIGISEKELKDKMSEKRKEVEEKLKNISKD